MNVHEVNTLLKNPAQLAHTDTDELREICRKYPYFQSAQLLLAKKLHDIGDFDSPLQLRRAAISIPSGRRLYNLLFKEKLRALIEKHLEELETDDEGETEVQQAAFSTPIPVKSLQKKPEVEDGSDQKNEVQKENAAEAEEKTKEDEKPLAFELETEILRHAAQSAYYLRSEPKPDEKENAGDTKKPAKPEKPIEDPKKPQKFGDWLRVLDSDQLDEIRKKERKKDAGKLIDEFIEKQPQISKAENGFDFEPGVVSKMDAVQDDEFVSETLAKIYAEQGNVPKAKKIYRKLIFKYPEKKSYFARQIEELEKK